MSVIEDHPSLSTQHSANHTLVHAKQLCDRGLTLVAESITIFMGDLESEEFADTLPLFDRGESRSFLPRLQRIKDICTDAIEMIPANLVLDSGICSELIREAGVINQAFDEHPAWPGQHFCATALEALTNLNSIVEGTGVLHNRAEESEIAVTLATNQSEVCAESDLIRPAVSPQSVEKCPEPISTNLQPSRGQSSGSQSSVGSTIVLELSLDGGRILWTNPAWTRISGFHLEDIQGNLVSDFLSLENTLKLTDAAIRLQEDASQFVLVQLAAGKAKDAHSFIPEMEGKGILTYDRLSGTPSHIMWVLRPLNFPIVEDSDDKPPPPPLPPPPPHPSLANFHPSQDLESPKVPHSIDSLDSVQRLMQNGLDDIAGNLIEAPSSPYLPKNLEGPTSSAPESAILLVQTLSPTTDIAQSPTSLPGEDHIARAQSPSARTVDDVALPSCESACPLQRTTPELAPQYAVYSSDYNDMKDHSPADTPPLDPGATHILRPPKPRYHSLLYDRKSERSSQTSSTALVSELSSHSSSPISRTLSSSSRSPSAASIWSVESQGWSVPRSLKYADSRTPSPPHEDDQVVDLTDQITYIGQHPIAVGGYSTVRLGAWSTASASKSGGAMMVVIKTLHALNVNEWAPDILEHEKKTLKHLLREVRVWQSLHHPNIAPLCGYMWEKQISGIMSASLVSPYHANGRVAGYLAKHLMADRVKLCCDVGEGLFYLHNYKPVVIHGDLTGANILVDDDGRAVICDFGLSSLLDAKPTGFTSSNFGGTTRYLAPELMENDSVRPTTQSDVYAFSFVGMEILHDQVPYARFVKPGPLFVAMSRRDPPFDLCDDDGTAPDGPFCDPSRPTPLWLADLFRECWRYDPARRPTMREVVKRLSHPRSVRDGAAHAS